MSVIFERQTIVWWSNM